MNFMLAKKTLSIKTLNDKRENYMILKLFQWLFPKLMPQLYEAARREGIDYEFKRTNKVLAAPQIFEKEQWLGQKIIVISDGEEEPWIGTGVDLYYPNGVSSIPSLVGVRAIDGKEKLLYGYVMPFSLDILQGIMEMNPNSRLAVFTKQKCHNELPKNDYMSNYGDICKQLIEVGFLDK